MKSYPTYHAHKSSKKLIGKRIARFLAKPVAFTFLGMVLCAFGTTKLMAEQQAKSDQQMLVAMASAADPVLLPPPVK